MKEQSFFDYIAKALKQIYTDIRYSPEAIILIVPLAAVIYFGLTVPVSLDESITFLEYTNQPFLRCVTSYPAPNNHVLHSILTHIFNVIPISNILFKIRIPVILTSICTWLLMYSLTKKVYNEKIALFITAIVSTLFMYIFYGFMSRGYALVSLFFIIGFFASYNIIKKGQNRNDWIVFSICSILGFYTMPSFLYPFLTLNLIILIFKPQNLKKQILLNAIVALIVIALYTPIIINDGIGALSNNYFVTPKTRLWVLTNLPIFFGKTLQSIIGTTIFIIIPIILLAFYFAIKKKDKKLLLLWVLFACTPVILLICHSVIPFERTFIYYGFVLILLIALSFSDCLQRIQTKWLIIGLLLLQIIQSINFALKIDEYEAADTYYKKTNDRIIEKNKTYYISNLYDGENHRFEMEIKGFNPDKNAFYDKRHIDISADSINSFDYVIIDVAMDKTTTKKPIYSNKEQNVYTQN